MTTSDDARLEDYSQSHDQALKAIKSWVENKFDGRLKAKINCSARLWIGTAVLHHFSSVDLILYADYNEHVKPLIAIQLTYNISRPIVKLRDKIFADIVRALPSKAPAIIVLVNKDLPKSYELWAEYLSVELRRVVLISEFTSYPQTIFLALCRLLDSPLAGVVGWVLHGSQTEK